MDRKKVILLLASFVLLFATLSGVVLAQEEFRLSDIFETIKGFDIANTYEKFPFLIDSLIYFIFFISIAQVTLGKQFEGKGGRGLVISVGLVLAVAISFWAARTGFTLGRLGPLAAMIFALVIGIKIYRLLKGDEKMGAAIWITIIVGYVSLYMFLPELIAGMQESTMGRLALGVLTFAFLIALPMAIYSMFKAAGPAPPSEGGNFQGLLPGSGRGRQGQGPSFAQRANPLSQHNRGRRQQNRQNRAQQRNLQDQADVIREKITNTIRKMQEDYDKMSTIANRSGIYSRSGTPVDSAVTAATSTRTPNPEHQRLREHYNDWKNGWVKLNADFNEIALKNKETRDYILNYLQQVE